MIVKFTTKSFPDIIMFGNIATKLLKMSGHSGTVPSAIAADDVTEYRGRLVDALSNFDEGEVPQKDTSQNNNDNEPHISLKQRAKPLIELFDSAIENGDVVTWEQS